MGTESFLHGASGQAFTNIEEAIEDLRDASQVFVSRIDRGDKRRAGEVSLRAFQCFDHIAGELLRIRDDRKLANMYAGTPFEISMQVATALMVESVPLADQTALAAAGPGLGRLPTGVVPTSISLEKTLNKIKHRHRTNLNFRIEAGRHFFLVCPNRPDGIVEFEVLEFCDLCLAAARAL